MAAKLWLFGLMSSLCWVRVAGFAAAHEVVPTVADLYAEDGQIRIEMRVNIEAQVSGINLDRISDTDAAENVSDYDALRALPADAVAERSSDLVARWNAEPLLMAGGHAVDMRLEG